MTGPLTRPKMGTGWVWMRDSEQQLILYRLLVEKSLGLMCIHDLDGVLLAVNPAVGRSLGYPPEAGTGRNLKEFLAASVRHLFDDYLQRIRIQGMDSGFMRLVASDGTERVWSYRNIRHDEPGKPPVVLGHALDVTAQVATDLALKESRIALTQARDELALRVAERTSELQQANERLRMEIEQRSRMEEEALRVRKLDALGVMAGGIAHDFNNFLTIVQGNIALAAAQIEPGSPLQEILNETLSACGRAASLASQLLTFSKGGAPVRKTGDLTGLLREAVALAGAGSPVRFQLEIEAGLWPCEFDAGQMSQALHSVLLNARQASEAGGAVSVRAGNTVAGEGLPVSPGRYILISIRDQGCGIPPEIVPRIFDPYFTTREGGAGLGLATAHAIVIKHQGYIAVQSKLEAGTTVSIYLPAASREAASVAAKGHLPAQGRGKILVMDDEDLIRKLLTKTLGRLGYEVKTARNGQEAIAMYRQAAEAGDRFNAVIADLTIPGGMGGKPTADKLKAMDPSAKIILSSGYSDDSTIAEFRRFGFDGVLLKPWTQSQLNEVLEQVLGE
ncbi:MAG TPA: ATP-binding protein [Bryobacteraceae bacterium]|nr:ATP-binding protein [Bryobacteraceae bacterium]